MSLPRKYYLVPNRATVYEQFCSELISSIEQLTAKYNLELWVSTAADILEVYDPKARLPEGYEYVASVFNGRNGLKKYRVEELVPEDRAALQKVRGESPDAAK